MREGLDAPTLELPAETVDEIRAFLDGQSRFRLAVWVRHERLTHEPVVVSAEALETFGRLVRAAAPEVVRVTATRSRLWKGDMEIEDSTNLCVACNFDQISPPGQLGVVQEAAREAGIAHSGGLLERPTDPPAYATVLYDQGTDR
jgi:hypothetical protein